jgi:hypothetical protein
MKPYLIYTFNWDDASAGNIVLHKLAQALHKRFPNDVYVLAIEQNGMSIPGIYSCQDDRDNCIAIYPEVIGGNPFSCGSVVRYLLNVPGAIGGPSSFPVEDFLFVYSNIFNSRIGLPKDRILYTPCLNTQRFRDKGFIRTKVFYYKGKGNTGFALGVDPLPAGTSFRGAERQEELVNLLNQTSILFSYDCVTAMNEVARLCGCPVVLMPNHQWTREDCLLLDTWEAGGMGYGLEEMEYAKDTINSTRLKERYDELEIRFQKQLDNFISVTQG